MAPVAIYKRLKFQKNYNTFQIIGFNLNKDVRP